MENEVENNQKYVSYKKVLLFGAKSKGKSSFSDLLMVGVFREDIQHTGECE